MEDIIEPFVIKGVFVNRYLDTIMFIRASSIEALGTTTMAIRRPDIFLNTSISNSLVGCLVTKQNAFALLH
eukprot:1230031-Ditylum_brightwellii.AAC.1